MVQEEIFRIVFKSPEAYAAAKNAIIRDSMIMGITTPLFSFDDTAQVITSHHSHFYERLLFEGMPTAEVLGLNKDTYDYFTNRDNDQTIFSVIPNIAGYQKRRQEALDFYAARPIPPLSPQLTIDLNSATSHDVIAELLRYSKAAIGDYHEMRAPKVALIRNMQALQKSGATLLMEHLFIDQQPMLEKYLSSSGSDQIASEIGFYGKNVDRCLKLGNDGLMEIMRTARAYGVPVQGIEDAFSLDAGAFGAIAPLPGMPLKAEERIFNRYDRCLLMNHNALAIAEDLERKGIRSLTFAGGRHLGESVYEGMARIPGLASSYGVPRLEIHDKPMVFQEQISTKDSSVFYFDPDTTEPVRGIPEVSESIQIEKPRNAWEAFKGAIYNLLGIGFLSETTTSTLGARFYSRSDNAIENRLTSEIQDRNR